MTDEDLDRLLRLYVESEVDDYDPPPPDMVAAYITGKATAAQRLTVRSAILRSMTFRRELVEAAEDLERWERLRAEGAIDSGEVPKVPTWREFLARHAARLGTPPDARPETDADAPLGSPERPLPMAESPGSPVPRDLFKPFIVRGAACAETEGTATREAPRQRLPPTWDELLQSRRRRAAGPTAWHAAIRSLMKRVHWTGGGFQVVEDLPALQPPESQTCTVLFVEGPDRRTRLEASFELPPDPWGAEVWLLLVPSLRLFSVALTRTPVRILWPVASDERAYAALSFEAETSEGEPFDPEPEREAVAPFAEARK